jgi:excisionase family DNA binding protein
LATPTICQAFAETAAGDEVADGQRSPGLGAALGQLTDVSNSNLHQDLQRNPLLLGFTSWKDGPMTPSLLSDVKFLTIYEVAVIMRLSKMSVYRLVHSGELETVRVGRSFRVPEQAVASYLRGAAFAPGS